MTELKPFISWVGSKKRIANTIISSFPDHTLYVEPMIGGGSILFKMKPKKAIIGDTNIYIVNTFRVIRNRMGWLVRRLEKLQNEYQPMNKLERKEWYYKKRARFNSLPLNNKNSVELASLFILINKIGFNGLYQISPKDGRCTTAFGTGIINTIYKEENIQNISKYLKKSVISIVHGSYEKTIEKALQMKNEKLLIYIDPPYHNTSKVQNKNWYGSNTFDQNALKKYISTHLEGIPVFVSNSYNEYITNLYKDHKITIIPITYVIGAISKRNKKQECLIHI